MLDNVHIFMSSKWARCVELECFYCLLFMGSCKAVLADYYE